MAFTEETKYEVKKLAQLSCCICKSIGIEVHHIIPQSEGGSDDIGNAAPLCPSCHELYGANPTKRKFIKESRNIWYEICENRFTSDSDRIKQLHNDIKLLSDRLDVKFLSENIADNLFKRLKESPFFINDKNENQSWSLGEIIKYFLEYKEPIEANDKKNIDICYALLYETKGSNDAYDLEYNMIKEEFLKTFGIIIARKLTINLVKNIRVDWFKGAPEYELNRLLNANFIDMLLLLHHKELNPSEFSLNVIVNKNEDLEAWLDNYNK